MKKKKGLNIIDILILLMLAAALLSIGYFFLNRGGMFTKYKYDIEYTVRVENIDASLAAGIAEGDTICDKYTALSIGTVEKVTVDARYVHDGAEDTVRMSIRVRTRAEEHDGLLSVNGVTVAKGQNIYFRTPNLEYLGQCVEVSILNGEEGLYDKAGRDEKAPL